MGGERERKRNMKKRERKRERERERESVSVRMCACVCPCACVKSRLSVCESARAWEWAWASYLHGRTSLGLITSKRSLPAGSLKRLGSGSLGLWGRTAKGLRKMLAPRPRAEVGEGSGEAVQRLEGTEATQGWRS